MAKGDTERSGECGCPAERAPSIEIQSVASPRKPGNLPELGELVSPKNGFWALQTATMPASAAPTMASLTILMILTLYLYNFANLEPESLFVESRFPCPRHLSFPLIGRHGARQEGVLRRRCPSLPPQTAQVCS